MGTAHAMAGRLPEHEIVRPVGLMRWDCISFLHWPYRPDLVGSLLPGELEPDTYDGRAWVSITPFVMQDVRPQGMPPIPGVSTFPETNVRTYVRDRETGEDGLWFLSLDTTRAVSLAARVSIGIPYCWAQMSVRRRDAGIVYCTAARRIPHQAGVCNRIGIQPGSALTDEERTPLDDWLTGRWRAFSKARGRLFCTPVEHQPWPLQHAATSDLDFNLLPPVGLPAPAGAPLVHFSEGVDVQMGRPRHVG